MSVVVVVVVVVELVKVKVFEIANPADSEEIFFNLIVPRRHREMVEKQVHSFFPEASIEDVGRDMYMKHREAQERERDREGTKGSERQRRREKEDGRGKGKL